MTNTRRNMFKTSIFSALGLISAPAVVRAAMLNSGDSHCESQDPILLRSRRGYAVLLEPGPGGSVRAYEVRARPGAALPSDIRREGLRRSIIENPQVERVPIETRDLIIRGRVLKIRHGLLEEPLTSLTVDTNFQEIQFGEIDME